MLEPIHSTVVVPAPPEAAFRRFTDDIASWWPLASHSVGQEQSQTCVFEARPGGRIYERLRDGSTALWGTVSRCDPPHRLAFSWHPGRAPETAQTVTVSFSREGTGTRLELVHGGWERFGTGADAMHANYARGWDFVLRQFTAPAAEGRDAPARV
ncbi:MAG TPA: SRPBCC domain-containing protein [Gammaproteobacteria bacterium]|nr:SRPBCC domain-containing protein [Gammaproteobacteria bacterium]